MTALIILIWLVGSVTGYFLGRKYIKKIGKYTISDRRFNLTMAIFSWMDVIAIGLMFLIFSSSDKPAKW